MLLMDPAFTEMMNASPTVPPNLLHFIYINAGRRQLQTPGPRPSSTPFSFSAGQWRSQLIYGTGRVRARRILMFAFNEIARTCGALRAAL